MVTMMPSKSKAKGNKHEADISKLFSMWSGKTWHKVPNSGALRWRGAFWTYGDVVPPEGIGAVIECKHHEEISIEDLLGNQRRKPGEEADIASWWYDEAVVDANRCKKELGLTRVEPLLVWKRNFGRNRLCFDMSMLLRLCKKTVLHLGYLTVDFPELDPFVICDLKDFFEAVPFDLCFPPTDV